MCNKSVTKTSYPETNTEQRDSESHNTFVAVSETQTESQDTLPESLKIEDIFAELGGFSRFQICATLVVILPEIAAAMIAVAPVFTGTSNVAFSCGSGFNHALDFNQEPRSVVSDGQIYSGMDKFICSLNCTNRIPFGFTYASVVQEWDLVCDRAWITDTCQSIQMGGMMTGSFVNSIIADRYGRKKSFYLMCLLMAVFGALSGVMTDVYSYAVMKFLAGLGVGGFYVVYIIYLMEFLTPSWRTICGTMSIWFLGELLLTLLAYFIQSWRYLTLAASLPALLIFLTYPFMPESPRWLLCQGRLDEARQALDQMARWNSKPVIAPETIGKLEASILKEEGRDSNDCKLKTSSGTITVLGNPELRLNLFLFLFGWFTCALVYYGITFNVKNLSGDPYLNVMYMGLVDFVGFPFGALFNNWLGRKKTYSACLVVGAIFLVALVVAEKVMGLASNPLLVTILCFLGKFGLSAAWGVVQCFTSESFPTVVRSACLGLCSLAANVGGVLAPQLAFLGIISPSLPYYIFCGFTVVTAASSWFLGETNGKVLKNFIN